MEGVHTYSSDFVRLIVTIWAIWGARRKAIHEDIFKSPSATDGFINSYLADLQVVKGIAKRPATVGVSILFLITFPFFLCLGNGSILHCS